MFKKLIGIVGGARNAAIMGAACAVALAGSFGAGYLSGGRGEARIQLREVEKRIYVPVKEIQEVQVRNVQRERVLQESLERSRLVAADQRARLDAISRDNRILDARVVGLLNDAITDRPTTDTPGVPVGETTTVTNLTDWAFDATNQYNDTAARYNALIDWVEEELIEPQKEVP